MVRGSSQFHPGLCKGSDLTSQLRRVLRCTVSSGAMPKFVIKKKCSKIIGKLSPQITR